MKPHSPRAVALALAGLALGPAAPAALAAQDPTPPAASEDPPIPADTELVTLPSGLAYSLLAAGSADAGMPAMGDAIRVHYTGWTTDGKVFDSSRKAPFAGGPIEPVTFALGQVIEGWNEGMQHCPVGGRIKLTIPAKLAYGDRGVPQAGIAGGATLVFDIELLSIEKRALFAVEWPTDPSVVQKGESGLEWVVLEPGTGDTLAGRIATAEYAARNLGGGWIGGSTYSSPRSAFNGPLVLGAGNPPFRFVKEAQKHLRAGSRVLFRVPPDLAFGQRELPNLPANSPSLWHVQVVSTLDAAKPEFALPPEEELTSTATGLKYKVLREGNGRQPKASSTVLAHYTGWLTTGAQFDSSWDRGEPISFSLQQFVKGWTEGLQLVAEGGRILLVIPPELGYGARATGSIPANSTLVFVVDLVSAN